LCRHPSAGPSVPRPSGRVGDQDHHRVAVAPWPFASAARPQRRSGMRTVSRVFSGAGDDEARVERGARFPDCRRSRPNCGPAPRREHSGRCGVHSFGISENQRVTVTKGDRPGGQNFPASVCAYLMYSPSQPTSRSGLKNSRISRAKASGCSIAAKWPPRGITVQRRMSVKVRSATERGGRTISRGNAQ
jgi:hypothetical protein